MPRARRAGSDTSRIRRRRRTARGTAPRRRRRPASARSAELAAPVVSLLDARLVAGRRQPETSDSNADVSSELDEAEDAGDQHRRSRASVRIWRDASAQLRASQTLELVDGCVKDRHGDRRRCVQVRSSWPHQTSRCAPPDVPGPRRLAERRARQDEQDRAIEPRLGHQISSAGSQRRSRRTPAPARDRDAHGPVARVTRRVPRSGTAARRGRPPPCWLAAAAAPRMRQFARRPCRVR